MYKIITIFYVTCIVYHSDSVYIKLHVTRIYVYTIEQLYIHISAYT